MRVEEVRGPAGRSRLCAAIPERSGIESAVEHDVREVEELEALADGEDGLFAPKRHSDRAAEISVLGVRPARKRLRCR